MKRLGWFGRVMVGAGLGAMLSWGGVSCSDDTVAINANGGTGGSSGMVICPGTGGGSGGANDAGAGGSGIVGTGGNALGEVNPAATTDCTITVTGTGSGGAGTGRTGTTGGQ